MKRNTDDRVTRQLAKRRDRFLEQADDLTPAVAYIRMSGTKQEASPDRQREEIKRLAEKHHCRIIREYFDPAISGDKTEKRPEFQRMINDAETKGDFAVILCWDQDRFGRFDSIEAGRWIYPLRQAGVWLLTVAQGAIDWNDFTGRMMYGITQEGKHQFLVDLSKNVLSGKIKAAKENRTGNKPCYGFDREIHDETGRVVRRVAYGEKFAKPKEWRSILVPSSDPEIIATVRWMFQTFADSDISLTRLVILLNERNTPLKPKGGWLRKTVQYMLKNPVYVGTRPWGRRRTGKYNHVGDDGNLATGKGISTSKAPIEIENAHDGLIYPRTFQRVQDKLADRATTGQRPRYNRFLLSGTMRCGHCGGPLNGESFNDGRHRTRYYTCRRRKNGENRCPSTRLRQDDIERYVLDYVETRLFDPKTVEAIERVVYQRAKSRKQFKANTQGIKNQLAAFDRKITKGTENLLLAGPEDMAEMSRLLAGWREDREQLQARLETAAVNPQGETAEEMTAQAMAELLRLREHFKSKDPAMVRAVVKTLIERITIWWEPDGDLHRKRVARGLIEPRAARGVFGSTSRCGPCRSPRTASCLRRPALPSRRARGRRPKARGGDRDIARAAGRRRTSVFPASVTELSRRPRGARRRSRETRPEGRCGGLRPRRRPHGRTRPGSAASAAGPGARRSAGGRRHGRPTDGLPP